MREDQQRVSRIVKALGLVTKGATIHLATIQRRWSNMCHERWMPRERRHEQRFDEELRRLIDEQRPRPNRPAPVVEHERDEEPSEPERVRVEAQTGS
jgi:hypothetical protein